MMTERLSTFREAVRCFRQIKSTEETQTNHPGLDYMMAVKRCQRAFGIDPEQRWSRTEWAFWSRLCDAIHRWGDA